LAPNGLWKVHNLQPLVFDDHGVERVKHGMWASGDYTEK
jgi:hypothetical protein